jgi:phage I-like protein
MAVPKRSKLKPIAPKPDRGLAYAIERARTPATPIPTQYYVAAKELSEQTGTAVADLIAQLDDRIRARVLCSAQTQTEAERDGWRDVVDSFRNIRDN